ncbi:unnamed protein product, partial [Musa textilis]
FFSAFADNTSKIMWIAISKSLVSFSFPSCFFQGYIYIYIYIFIDPAEDVAFSIRFLINMF